MKIESIKSIKQIEILYLNDHLINLREICFWRAYVRKRDLYPNVNFQLYRKKSRWYTDERKQLNLLLNILSYADGKKTIRYSNYPKSKFRWTNSCVSKCLN